MTKVEMKKAVAIAKAVDKLAKLDEKAKVAKSNVDKAKTEFLAKFSESTTEAEVFVSDEHSVTKGIVAKKTYDVEGTRQLLADNGITDTADFFTITVNGKALEKAVKEGRLPKQKVEELLSCVLSVRLTIK